MPAKKILMDLTPREQVLFETLRSKKTAKSSDLLEALVDHGLSEPAGPDTTHRHGLIVAMKYLSAKVCVRGWIIERTSGLGRGQNAEYSIAKRF